MNILDQTVPLWVLIVIVLLWAGWKIWRFNPPTIVIGCFESKEEVEKFIREFEAALERDKDKARSFLHRSVM